MTYLTNKSDDSHCVYFTKQNTERWISIDNEDYEVKPIHATLLPKKVHVFYTPAESLSWAFYKEK
jgi:hypothetical protein